ncbi:transcriptional activator FtrB [uncultured Clostridium sp.]|nr:transcriptional activator FtrB [uncultured Clostridium sp.]
MQTYSEVFAHSPLLNGIAPEDYKKLLACLDAHTKHFPRGGYILHAGDPPLQVGMILSGSAHIMKEDFWGNRAILADVQPGELFGEAFACASASLLEVSAVATESSDILFFNPQNLLSPCPSACGFHTRLIRNLVGILAQKNVALTQKLEHLSRRSTREKLLSFLSACALRQGAARFTIPFNRQELADYLFVDRSAMSAELSKLRSEGLIAYHKNQFQLLQANTAGKR